MPRLHRLLHLNTFAIVLFCSGIFSLWLTLNWIGSLSRPREVSYKTSLAKSTPNVKPPYERALVVAAVHNEDIRWTRSWGKDPSLKSFVYVVDDPDAINKVPRNKGHEAMVYLTYIIDQYDTLANLSIFMHAAQWSWHNDEFIFGNSVEMVSRLNPLKIQRDGYMNLRCRHVPGCPDHIHPFATDSDLNKRPEEPYVGEAWKEMFPSAPVPETLAQPCCSQFSVSSDNIRSQPLEQYIHLRKWILSTTIPDRILGRILEYVWQYLFTGQYVLCPDEIVCYCEGYDACFKDSGEKDDWYALYEQFREVRRKGSGLMGTGEAAMARKKALGDAARELTAQLDEKRDLVFARTKDEKSHGLHQI